MNRLLLSTYLFLLLAGTAAVAQDAPNSPSDDYAASFRTTPEGAELWFTTGEDAPNGRSRVLKRSICLDGAFAAPELIDLDFPGATVSSGIGGNIELTGSPTFAACDGRFGLVTSNRSLGDRALGNDLYEIRMVGSEWQARRADELNSPHWDDTPALSPDGNVVYFASDRRRPGSQRPDIYMAHRSGDGWSEPVYVDAINTEHAEESPYVGEDGYLYFSTNVSGDYDIWRVRLDPETLLPSDAPYRLGLPGVNERGSDETHPLYSPGGNWFLFSTNRAHQGHRDFDIVWTNVPQEERELTLDVRLRTRDATQGIATTVSFHDLAGGASGSDRSAEDGSLTLRIKRNYGDNPAQDIALREIVLRAETPSRSYVSSIDTLAFSMLCPDELHHTLFLWDTGTYRTPTCTQEFPIYQVRFFVTGYWCPTTQRYRDYAPCASLFTEEACIDPPCGDHGLYDFTITKRPKYPDCIRYGEFQRSGEEFAREVDSAFGLLREAMRSAFGIPCLSAAIAEGKRVRVEVIGSTDPRGYKEDCEYTGETIDFSRSFVQIADERKPYFTTGTSMKQPDDPTGGNKLLSDLRAYNTAVMLDRIWDESIPEYHSLRNSNQLDVTAFGEAVSTEETSYERQRSIRVRVTLPDADGQLVTGVAPDPGRRVVLCSRCGGYSPGLSDR